MQETESLGRKLKILRKEKGINQQEIADCLGITRQNYSAYEAKGTIPPIDNLCKLALFFDVSSDYLLGLSEQRNPIKVFSANNISSSNVVQGSGTVTVNETDTVSKEESELLRIYRDLDVRGRAKLLNAAFALEDESKKES